MTATATQGREEKHTHYSVSSRKVVCRGSDAFVKEITLGVGEEVPMHHHTEVFDIFYCLEGQLHIEKIAVDSNESLPSDILAVGESAKVDTGVAHRPFNPGPNRVRFLLIQGIGRYDYLPFAAAGNEK